MVSSFPLKELNLGCLYTSPVNSAGYDGLLNGQVHRHADICAYPNYPKAKQSYRDTQLGDNSPFGGFSGSRTIQRNTHSQTIK